MGWYSAQFKNDLDARNNNPKEKIARHDPLSGLWVRMFVDNLKLVLTLLPALFLFVTFLITGALIFLAGALLTLCLAGPAVVALYDFGYTVARDIPASTGRTFFQSYRLNFRQGTLTMLLVALMAAPSLLVMIYVAPTQAATPWMTATLFIALVLVMDFAVHAFSQIALVDMPLRKIYKNALFLIPVSRMKGIVVALAIVIYLGILYAYMERAVLTLLVYIPTLIIVYSASFLWPIYDELLVRSEENEESSEA